MVTSDCNIGCFYCHNEGRPKTGQFVKPDLVQHLREIIQYSGTSPKISLVGGEPLYHPQLNEIVKALAPVSSKLSITTNGIFLTKAYLSSLKDSGCTKIRLGVDSISRGKFRPSHIFSSDRKIVEIAQDIADAGMPFEINTVITGFNAGEMPELLKYAYSVGVDAKFFELIHVDGMATSTKNAQIRSKAAMEFSDFDNIARSSLPVVRVASDTLGSNTVYYTDRNEVRYCRYLHQFGACARSGTRIGPNGYAVSCMERMESEIVSPQNSMEQSCAIIAAATNLPCIDPSE